MQEKWKAIPGAEGYEISNLGRCRSLLTWRTNKPRIKYLETRRNQTGIYPRLSIRRPTLTPPIKMDIAVHVLVARLFVLGWFKGAEVDHKDRNKQNPRASNLRWVTHSFNIKRSRNTGWISAAEAKAVRYLGALGIKRRKIADAFDLTLPHVCMIIKRRTKGKRLSP